MIKFRIKYSHFRLLNGACVSFVIYGTNSFPSPLHFHPSTSTSAQSIRPFLSSLFRHANHLSIATQGRNVVISFVYRISMLMKHCYIRVMVNQAIKYFPLWVERHVFVKGRLALPLLTSHSHMAVTFIW